MILNIHKMLFSLITLDFFSRANAKLISMEDFETGATGWSNNLTTDGGATLTTFLGRFPGNTGAQENFKTYFFPEITI